MTSGTKWSSLFFFFNDTATTEIYTLSLHDALPISSSRLAIAWRTLAICSSGGGRRPTSRSRASRSEEHTSELQSRLHLVCRLLLEKKKKTTERQTSPQVAQTHRRTIRAGVPHSGIL